MGTKSTATSMVSVSNTKKEILDAYSQLKMQFEDSAQGTLQPEKEKERIKNKEVIIAAEALAATNVINSIDELNSSLNETLADIATKMKHEVDRYTKVKEAIVAKEVELKEIFEIEQSAYSLAALLEAQKQKRVAFDEEIGLAKTAWEQEKKEHVVWRQEQKEQDKKIRQREQEEYDYKLKREREQKTNTLRDEISRLEKELARKKEEFEQKVTTKEAQLKERETTVAQNEKRFVSLEIQVDKFPADLEKAVNKAIKETSDRLTGENSRDKELLNKGFEGEKNVFSARIQALEQLAAEQKKQLAQLTAQLEKAYGKVQDIAISAVSSSRERYAGESQGKGAAPAETV